MEVNTNAEILQRITRVETVVEGMNEKIDNAINAKDIAIKATLMSEDNTRRITVLEDSHKWLFRTIGGTAIVTVIGVIVTVLKMGVV